MQWRSGMKLIALFFISFFPSEAEAAVHLLKGNLIEKRAYTIGASQLILVYDSRSLHNGVWGFGWCSNLESQCAQYYNLKPFVGTPPALHSSTPFTRLLHTSQGEWIRLSFFNENLVKIEFSGGSEEYKYDGLHNLTQITYEDSSTKEIQYNAELDAVISVRGRSLCLEKYIYSREGEQNLSTTVQTFCANEKPKISKYEFLYKISSVDADRLLRLNVLQL